MAEMRDYAKVKLDHYFPKKGNLYEKELFEYVKSISGNKKGWDFYKFRKLYKRNLQVLLENLQRPESGLNNILKINDDKDKEKNEIDDVDYFSSVLRNDPRKWEPKLWMNGTVKNDDSEIVREGLFSCSYCARRGQYARNTSHYEKQTRSADEPACIYLHCHSCFRDVKFSA